MPRRPLAPRRLFCFSTANFYRPNFFVVTTTAAAVTAEGTDIEENDLWTDRTKRLRLEMIGPVDGWIRETDTHCSWMFTTSGKRSFKDCSSRLAHSHSKKSTYQHLITVKKMPSENRSLFSSNKFFFRPSSFLQDLKV